MSRAKADRFVGIDVSKARVDVHVQPEGTAFYCATDTEGLASLVERLTPLQPRPVVLEASGGYEGVISAACRLRGSAWRSTTRRRPGSETAASRVKSEPGPR
jgi:transposase